ncbi:MAG TPA: tyrosine-type recombinase/integrase [Caulobacteraceae bacterium]|nr:tyrosine-type recombinase/integrase [Caulobacteraceae bacterium]
MSALRQALKRYLRMRRGFGYRYNAEARLLGGFVAFMEAAQATVVTRGLAMAWITQAERTSWPQRLSAVRGFARHLTSFEPATETPPAGIFPSPRRARPYIYTEGEIAQLLEATLGWGQAGRLDRWTYHCLFGLLATTGMRVGEAMSLRRADVDLDAGMLTLRETKGGKQRLVPLHPSATLALAGYAGRRDASPACRGSPWFFVLQHGQPLRHQYAHRVFIAVLRRVGLRDPEPHSPGPRLHDLRHSFAVGALLRWHRAGEDVESRLPTLATYLGHSKVCDTYWYLSACPELMDAAVVKLEARWGTPS